MGQGKGLNLEERITYLTILRTSESARMTVVA